MGSAASSQNIQTTEIKTPYKDEKQAELLASSPLDDVPTNNGADKTDGEAGPKVSAGKLKKMALGQQSYKDQHRAYDSTMSKLEKNRVSEVNWSVPVDVNTALTQQSHSLATNSKSFKSLKSVHSTCSISSNEDNNEDDGRRADPGWTNASVKVQSTDIYRRRKTDNSLSIIVDKHDHPEYQKVSTNSYKNYTTQNPNSTIANPKGNNAKASSVHNMQRNTVIPVGASGQRLMTRPFPRGSGDTEDDMIANFATLDESKLPLQHKKPDNVPLLTIGNSNNNSSSGSIKPNQVVKQGSDSKSSLLQAHGSQQKPPHSAGGGRRAPPPNAFSSPLVGGSARSTGPSPPTNLISPMKTPGSNPSSSRPMSTNNSGRPSTGLPPNNLPIVKETKDVKRNRAQIPTKLTHAKPTTGDWLNKRYIVNNYILLETLGTGSYGEVRLCKDRTTDKLYAIKIISKDFLKKKKNGKTSETYFEDIKREIAIMKKLNHPNVLQLFEVLDDPKVNKMYLVLEYMKMGDLVNILKSRGIDGTENKEGQFTPLNDIEVWNIFRQVVSGIKYLHYQNVIHGDIKPQNLLLGEDGIVKIADFGISQMLHKSSQKIADAAGTPAFMSPELCEQKSFSGQLADIWAIGITIYMLRYGHPPFMAKTVLALYSKIVNDPVVFPYMIDPGLRNLLENVLEKDPMKRFTLQQIIAHPWLRQPPSISVIQKSQRHPSQQNKGNSLNHFDHAQATADSKINLSFMPPPSYNEQEAAAMNAPVKTVDNHEIYQSIGVRVEKERKGVPDKKGISEADEEESIDVNSDEYDSNSDDEDDENNTKQAIAIAKPTGSIAQNNKYQSTDLMATNWGADVFEMVDDDGDDDDDEDVDSDDDEKKDQVTGLNNGVSAIEASNSMRQDNSIDQKESVRSEMSDEEQALRSKRFMGRRNKKSLENMNSIIDDSPKVDSNGLRRKVFSEDSPSAKSTRSNSGKTLYKFTFDDKARNKSTISNCEDTDDPNQISMEEFESMMDTLAMQPRKGADDDESDDDDLDEHDRQLALNESKALGFSAHLWNQNNGVAAAFHSEQGVRPSQEDRCILLPNVAKMKALEGYEMPDKVRDQLEKFSLACVFDGHSGWRCSQYLSQHLAGELVTHPNFLEKQIDVAIKETFCSIDQQICQILRDEDDASGSTGVVAIYDGRKHIFTVAGVGDSMCVLSRAGKAVMLNRMHRLNDSAERERVKNAGGVVINNRVNGLLAVSRAFGDTQFKGASNEGLLMRTNDSDTPINGQLVIALPDVHSEIITPMTEFGIVASDGLWDVLSPQAAVNFVRNKLTKSKDLQIASKDLVMEALGRGSVDNVTVLLISFHTPSVSIKK